MLLLLLLPLRSAAVVAAEGEANRRLDERRSFPRAFHPLPPPPSPRLPSLQEHPLLEQLHRKSSRASVCACESGLALPTRSLHSYLLQPLIYVHCRSWTCSAPVTSVCRRSSHRHQPLTITVVVSSSFSLVFVTLTGRCYRKRRSSTTVTIAGK